MTLKWHIAVCVIAAVVHGLVALWCGLGGYQYISVSVSILSDLRSLQDNGKIIPGRIVSVTRPYAFGEDPLYDYQVVYKGYTEPKWTSRQKNRTAFDSIFEEQLTRSGMADEWALGDDGLPRLRAGIFGRAEVPKTIAEAWHGGQAIDVTVSKTDPAFHTVGRVDGQRMAAEKKHHIFPIVRGVLLLVMAAALAVMCVTFLLLVRDAVRSARQGAADADQPADSADNDASNEAAVGRAD